MLFNLGRDELSTWLANRPILLYTGSQGLLPSPHLALVSGVHKGASEDFMLGVQEVMVVDIMVWPRVEVPFLRLVKPSKILGTESVTETLASFSKIYLRADIKISAF